MTARIIPLFRPPPPPEAPAVSITDISIRIEGRRVTRCDLDDFEGRDALGTDERLAVIAAALRDLADRCDAGARNLSEDAS